MPANNKLSKTLSPVIADLEPYKASKHQLIPLHRYNATDQKKRERGKSPLDAGWRTKSYSLDQTIKHAQGGSNVGVRLSAEDFIVDIDPRRFPKGADPLAAFCKATGLDPAKCPTVNTGSGGWHLYLRKPAGVKLVDSLKDFEGVEFKSLGRQVVAAGSVHPNGRHYTWNEFRPDLADAPMAPDKALRLATRPDRVTGSDGGEMSPEELSRCLALLDPVSYNTNGPWLEIMMACHHGTGGEGRQEFIDWSTGDPQFADHAWEIGRRWDSLKVSDGEGITVRTLYRDIIKAGGDVPKTDASDDFEALTLEERKELGEGTAPLGPRRLSPLQQMNQTYCIVDYNGVFKVMREVMDPVLGRTCYYRYRRQDFMDLNASKTMETSDGKVKPVAEEWIKWSKARRYNGVIFNPDPNRKSTDDTNYLNLWRGWLVEPAQGDWQLMKDLVLEVLCNHSENDYNYVLDWIANMLQRPHKPAEVAIAFKGDKGTGKGTLLRALVKLANQHGLHIASPDHLAGRFNGHLRDCIFLFADEAFYAGNKSAESILKALITEPTVAYERKGQDIEQGKNMIHVGMASNSDWVVPAGMDERRFAIFNVNNEARGDIARFAAIEKQMYTDGGLEAMLYELLLRDIEGWHPRENIPQNVGLAGQKMRGLDHFGTWWFELLMAGSIAGAEGDWEDFSIRVPAPVLFQQYEEYSKQLGIRNITTMSRLSVGLNKYVDGVTKHRYVLPEDYSEALPADSLGRVVYYHIPSLDKCRQAFDDKLGYPTDWLIGGDES